MHVIERVSHFLLTIRHLACNLIDFDAMVFIYLICVFLVAPLIIHTKLDRVLYIKLYLRLN